MSSQAQIAPPSDRKALVLSAILVAVQFAALALVSIYLSRQPGGMATLWFANGVGAAALLMRPSRQWPTLLVGAAIGNIAANLVYGDPIHIALAFVPGNLLDIFAAAFLLRTFKLEQNFQLHPHRLVMFIAIGCCIAPVFGSTLGAAALDSLGFSTFQDVWLAYYAGDVIGFLTILPAALAVQQCFRRKNAPCHPAVFVTTVTLSAIYTVSCLQITNFPYIFIAIGLGALAFYLSFAGVAINVAVSTIIVSVWATNTASPGQSLQFFDVILPVLTLALSPLLFASMRELQLSAEAKTEAAMEDLVRAFCEAPAMQQICEEDDTVLKVSDLWLSKLKVAREDVVGTAFEDWVHADDREQFSEFKRHSSGGTIEVRVSSSKADVTCLISVRTIIKDDVQRRHYVLQDVTEERRLAKEIESEMNG